MRNSDPADRVTGYIVDKLISHLLFVISIYTIGFSNFSVTDLKFVVILVFIIFYYTIKKYNGTPGMKAVNLEFKNMNKGEINTLFVTIAYTLFIIIKPGWLIILLNILPLYIGKENNRYDQTLMNKITKVRVVDHPK